ncbi:MAG TPA: DUF1036 domain-containing protein [Beijerinckiaceae bacterium]|nr:DUF1036 domain-containing protein [Beijerinckiaceae bacterium]
MRFLRFVSLVAALCAAAQSARADLRLCNNSESQVSVALAYTNGHRWITEGWWNLKKSGCEILMNGPLAAEFYYVYAIDARGGEWKGKTFMCTRAREFRIVGRENCLVRGYDRTGFFEIDTGKDARNWTVQLTDTSEPASKPQKQP